MRRPMPISLRLDSAEVIRHARNTLSRLAKRDLLRRRVKLQATKALIAFREMERFMSADERARWRTECETVGAFLKKIMDRGA
jgi:hypothetical protein